MTHAAATTRTLRPPRRRPHGPAAWERAGAVLGVVGASAFAPTIVRGDHITFSEEGA